MKYFVTLWKDEDGGVCDELTSVVGEGSMKDIEAILELAKTKGVTYNNELYTLDERNTGLEIIGILDENDDVVDTLQYYISLEKVTK